jgi:hypothetical protein
MEGIVLFFSITANLARIRPKMLHETKWFCRYFILFKMKNYFSAVYKSFILTEKAMILIKPANERLLYNKSMIKILG